MPPGYAFEFVTVPAISTSVQVNVTIANTGQNEEIVAVVLMPGSLQESFLDLPAQTIQQASVFYDAGRGEIATWVSIQVSSDQLVPTAEIMTPSGNQTYGSGDFVAYNLTGGQRVRLW